MSFPATPFDQVSVAGEPGEPGDRDGYRGIFDDDVDPAIRTPAFRSGQSDLEQEKLDMDDSEIMQVLDEYFDEAENARETGFNPRHQVWEQNLHAYWMRNFFDDKMPWQSREVSADVPNFVERFAAVHRQALTQTPDWAEVEDFRDQEGVYSRFGTRLTRLALDFAGTNATGQPVPFEFNFGTMCKTGALMEMAAAVIYDPRNGRIAVEEVDPRQCYLDPTRRGLYRVRFYEVDKETLLRQAEIVDSAGEPIYRKEAIEQLVAHHDMDIAKNQEDSSGQGSMLHSRRTPILYKEWLVDLIDRNGGDRGSRKVRERQLIVTANDHTIIRGPEPNPWWHQKDWVVMHPVLAAPLSAVGGRTYVELFRPAVETNENVMNRIIDIAQMNMNAYEVNPDVLDNVEQIEFGIAPNQTIMRSEDANPADRAITVIELGRTIGADLMRLWEASRQMAQEAAAQSDLSLGQTVQSGDTTATEIAASEQGQGSLNNSISMDIDMGFLGPIAELVYYTAIQKVGPDTPGIWNGLSEEYQQMLEASRAELRQRPIAIRARGLTKAVERRKRMRGLLGALNVIGGNPDLMAEFKKEFSTGKLLNVILEDMGVDIDRIKLSEQEKLQGIEQRAKALAAQQAQDALSKQFPGGPPGSAGAGGGSGRPPITSQNQNGLDPAAPGVPEGLPGQVL